MPSFSTFVAALAALSAGAMAAPSVRATGCCDTTGSCLTVSGTTSGGLHWCYGYHSGNIPFNADDGLKAQCLTQAHAKQNKQCIDTPDSSCNSGNSANVGSMLEARLGGDHTLGQDDSLAIQAAIGAAVANGLHWSDDTRFGPGFISFAHTAKNGVSMRGVEVFKRNLCKK